MQHELNTLRSLTACIASHSMFNMLTKLQSEILEGQKREAIHSLNLFSKMLRETSEIAECEAISLKRELQFLELYLQIEKARFIDIAMEVELLGFDNEMVLIAPFLIQPFIELGLLSSLKIENFKLRIEFKPETKQIEISSSVIDSKIHEKLDSKLTLAKQRLGHFGHLYERLDLEEKSLQKITLAE